MSIIMQIRMILSAWKHGVMRISPRCRDAMGFLYGKRKIYPKFHRNISIYYFRTKRFYGYSLLRVYPARKGRWNKLCTLDVFGDKNDV